MGKELRILILEDVPTDAELMERELCKAKLRFVSRRAVTEEVFLRELKDFTPDLILADYDLPSFDGISALAIAQKECPEVPFIFVSGAIGEELAIETLKMGASDYILKDRLSRLGPAVRRALRELEERSARKRAEEGRRQSLEKLRKTLEETINVLASAIEMRDPYTAGHQHRVTKLSCAIAKEMGLSEQLTEGLRLAATIHDIGKIHIPADILSKSGKLTEVEYEMIKNHPQVGCELLNTIQFPWPVAQIVLQHHERLDGSGYPQGISGKDIILEARILAVADFVEAVASHRPYRAGRGIRHALERISRDKGILYDPEVVDACLRVFHDKRFKFEEDMELATSLHTTPPAIHRRHSVFKFS